MRALFTLSSLVLLHVIADAQGLTFDPGSNVELDSIYPGNVWQVGAPDKVVFDSAYSAPNALVTDTLLPYPITGTTYAEFHMPVDYFGELVQLDFRQRMDVDSGEALGWVEWYDPVTIGWHRFMADSAWLGEAGESMYYGDGGTLTDSGLVFSHSSTGWTLEDLTFGCNALMVAGDRGGQPDTTMRFRFAFQASANSNGRDGWMIDDVVFGIIGPCSGIEEHGRTPLSIFPDPASSEVYLRMDIADGTPMDLRFIRSDGAVV
ncbi:MAG TPA: hypothetical protein VKG92_02570, partial [Flavobacteriales bacterium]|nr:hypothetical protein [Flavobacteriales bacterium]